MVGLVIGALYAALWTPVPMLFDAGAFLTLLGAIVGFPAGAVYHVLLYRASGRCGGPPEGWLWRPTSLHDSIALEDRGAVVGWCVLGAAGFVVLMLGLAIVTAAALRGWTG